MIKLENSSFLGRVIRSEAFVHQGVSTYEHLRRMIDQGRASNAIELLDYWLVEFSLSYNFYSAWASRLSDFLGKRMGPAMADEASVAALKILVGGDDRDQNALTQSWDRLHDYSHMLKELIQAGDKTEEALAQTERMRSEYEWLHDVQVAWSCLLLTEIANDLGEEQLETTMRETLTPWIQERYLRFVDPNIPWQEVSNDFLCILAESMRCHLSGPRRWGEFEIKEEEDRWVLTFDPCGSGCKASRGGGHFPALTDPPYNAGVTQKPHAWSWCRTGISYYCVHCCLLGEILPIELGGYPLRITDVPEDPADPCVWYVYKYPEKIPEYYYTRVGKTKPNRFSRT